MTLSLTIWALIGGAAGLIHGSYVYRQVVIERSAAVAGRPAVVQIKACYVALWTLGLWILFGGLVIILWVISAVAYGIAKPFGWRM